MEKQFIGKRISLISKSDIRYVGVLHEINPEESTVSLKRVRSMGTEGRAGDPAREVAAKDHEFEYVVFRATDVKDLQINDDAPTPPPQPKPALDDPAILGSYGAPDSSQPPSSHAPQQSQPTQYAPPPPQPGYGQPQFPPQPSMFAPPPFQSALGPYGYPPPGMPPQQPYNQSPPHPPALPLHAQQQNQQNQNMPTENQQIVRPTPAKPAAPKAEDGTDTGDLANQLKEKAAIKDGPEKSSDIKKPGSATSRPANLPPVPPKSTFAGSTAKANLPNPPVAPRGPGFQQRRHPPPSVPTTDFDFEKSKAEFEKDTAKYKQEHPDQASHKGDDDVVIPPAPNDDAVNGEMATFYDRKKSFFDDISSEAKERQSSAASEGARDRRKQEMSRNISTFGETGNFGGRGRRGYGRGRGYRGGRGRGGPRRGGGPSNVAAA